MQLFLIFILVSFAAENWEDSFSDVCRIDVKYCLKLKTSDGGWLKPKTEIMVLLKDPEIQTEIKSAAQKYGVSTTAIAGAIVAENSLNVGLKDQVQTWLASRLNITSLPGGKAFSFGLGQIKMPSAMSAEKYIADKEGRAPRTEKEMTTELSSPFGSIRTAAMILRQVQDDYKAVGFDIANQPEILTTLYNLGESEVRAKKAKDSGLAPQMNYFGLFVKKYAPDIDRYVAAVPPPTSPIQTTANPATSPNKELKSVADGIRKKRISASGSDPKSRATGGKSIAGPVVQNNQPSGRAQLKLAAAAMLDAAADNVVADSKQTEPIVDEKTNRVLATVISSPLPLTTAPFLCEKDDRPKERQNRYGQDVNSETKESGYGSPSGVAEAGQTFEELSRALDCKSVAWTLIKTQNGQIGWVGADQLESATESKLVSKANSCDDTAAQSECTDNLSKTLEKRFIAKGENGLLYLRPHGVQSQVGFEEIDARCGETSSRNESAPRVYAGSFGGGIGPSGAYYAGTPKVPFEKTGKDLIALNLKFANLADSELNRMAEKTQISKDQLLDAENAYNEAAFFLTTQKNMAESCTKSFTSEAVTCFDLNEKKLEEYATALNAIRYKNEPDYSDINKMRTLFDDGPFRKYEFKRQSIYLPPLDEAAKFDPGELQKRVRACERKISTKTKLDIGTSTSIFNSIARASNEGILKVAGPVAAFANLCESRLSLLNDADEDKNNPMPNSNKCNPENFFTEHTVFSKKIVSQIYQKDHYLFLVDLADVGNAILTNDIRDQLLGTQSSQYYSSYMTYCPNRTADFIEELLKDPCVKRVYVPTRYLSNKLNDLSPKVIFRRFEERDRFAVEVGGNECKK